MGHNFNDFIPKNMGQFFSNIREQSAARTPPTHQIFVSLQIESRCVGFILGELLIIILQHQAQTQGGTSSSQERLLLAVPWLGKHGRTVSEQRKIQQLAGHRYKS